MAVTYVTAVKNARMTAVRDAVANGTLELGTTGMAQVIATFGLTTSGGTVTGGVWTLAFDASTVSAGASGAAAAARIKNSGTTSSIIGLTVGTTGTDVILDNTNIAAGQSVTLSSATLTHA